MAITYSIPIGGDVRKDGICGAGRFYVAGRQRKRSVVAEGPQREITEHANDPNIWRKSLYAISLAPLLLLGACGNDPPCGEAGVTKTVRNFAAKYVITIGIPAKFPEDVDLSSSIELSAITTHSWDPNTKTAVCTSRYRLDQTALIQEAKAKSKSLNDSTLGSGIEKLPDRGIVVDGALAYSVKRTTDGQWWIELLDMKPD